MVHVTREFFVVVSDKQSADDFVAALPGTDRQQVTVAAKRSLDGSTGEWILLGLLSLRALRMGLETIVQLAALKRVKSLKIGDREIVNPSDEQVKLILSSVERSEDSSIEVPPED